MTPISRLKSVANNSSSKHSRQEDSVIRVKGQADSHSNTHHKDQHSPNPSLPKKAAVIIIILLCCCVVAFIINFINVHTDFLDLKACRLSLEFGCFSQIVSLTG